MMKLEGLPDFTALRGLPEEVLKEVPVKIAGAVVLTGLSRSEIYQRMAAGNFPKSKPLALGCKARGWDLGDILEWKKKQKEARS